MTLDDALTGLRDGTLTSINLSSNKLGDEGAKAIADALEDNKTLKGLDLRANQIGAKGATALAKALRKNTTLKGLYLDYNDIGSNGATALAKALKENTTLKGLYLDYNDIGSNGATALAKALNENTTVTRLDLVDNKIGGEGVTAIFKALEVNTTVTELYLGDNQIRAEGAKALAKALNENTSVTELDLSDNEIGDKGAQALAEALKVNKTVTKLDLSYNNIGDEGVQAIAEALKVNTTVTKLNSYNHEITDQQIKTDINNLLERNNKIKTIKDSLLNGEKIVRTKEDQCSINNIIYDNEVVALAIKDMVKDLEPSDKDSDSERNRKGDVTNDLKKVNKSNYLYALVRTLNSLDDSGKKIFIDTEKNIFIEEFVKSDKVIESIKSISLTLRSSKQSFLQPETRLNILYHMLPLAIGTIFTNKENNINIKKLDSFIQIFTPQGIGKMDIGYITHSIKGKEKMDIEYITDAIDRPINPILEAIGRNVKPDPMVSSAVATTGSQKEGQELGRE